MCWAVIILRRHFFFLKYVNFLAFLLHRRKRLGSSCCVPATRHHTSWRQARDWAPTLTNLLFTVWMGRGVGVRGNSRILGSREKSKQTKRTKSVYKGENVLGDAETLLVTSPRTMIQRRRRTSFSLVSQRQRISKHSWTVLEKSRFEINAVRFSFALLLFKGPY